VDFYDFEKGKEQPDRIVGTFSYRESDTYIPMVVYNHNDCAFAIGDNQISFYSSANRMHIQEKTVELQGEIRKVFYNSSYLGIVSEEEDGLKIRIYDMEGIQKDVVSQAGMYEHYMFDGEQIVMYNDSHFEIVAFSGRERFNRNFVNGIEELVPTGNKKTFYIVTADMLQKITLK